MISAQENTPLADEWRERFGLTLRCPPEFIQSTDEILDTPHAGAIRDAFKKLGLSALFCVQGVPSIAFLVQEEYDSRAVIDTHAALWNQGLANLLLVISGDTLRAFSLVRVPLSGIDEEFEKRCLISMLNAVTDALAFQSLITGVESGRLWEEHAAYFLPKERIDSVLLSNLSTSHTLLCRKGLSSDAAQALLMQAMFIAYLEDRSITNEDYFLNATSQKVSNFNELLSTGDTKLFVKLFKALRKDFNGDLFVAPCSFEKQVDAPSLNSGHMSVLARFRSGKERMYDEGGQHRFWGYDFRYIPVELISAVYDRFLGEKDEERRQQGAYYTPMFLADTVVSQLWSSLTPEIKEKGTFLDPACGSGVFLVRSFQRLCENWRETRTPQTIRWNSLLTILERIHGWDINGSAVRVAVFSLYIALLEQVSPPDIQNLIKRGKLLPKLWKKTLVQQDFFDVPYNQSSWDVVVGNPPWASRRGADRKSVEWCTKNDYPMPGKEDAWAFTWKALAHVSDRGIVAFLLPAMGFLHNHSNKTVKARNQLIEASRIRRIINFADLRFQLFEGATRPAALCLLEKKCSEMEPYRFEYWTPKADLNLQVKRFITLCSTDKLCLRSDDAISNSLIFKHRLWMRGPDAKLFNYLSTLPKLGDLIKVYGDLKRRRQPIKNKWVIGQGFQPLKSRSGDQGIKTNFISDIVTQHPFLDINHYNRLVLTKISENPWPSKMVRRKGFEEGFTGTRILIPRGVETAQTRLRASYTRQSLTFTDIIQAIKVPKGDEETAKLLTALLNSRIAVWFAFHGTSSFGSDRPEVKQAELLRLPFPMADDLPEPERARKAARQLIEVIDKLISKPQDILCAENWEQVVLSEIDKLSYEYFCLSDDEIAIIEDTIEQIIPAVQPHQNTLPAIWKPATLLDRQAYAAMLANRLADWLDKGWVVTSSLVAHNQDIGVLRLSLTPSTEAEQYREQKDSSLDEVLKRLWKNVHQPISGNFQLFPDLKIFANGELYLIKPMQKRFWLRLSALADADSIALDLQDGLALSKKQGHA